MDNKNLTNIGSCPSSDGEISISISSDSDSQTSNSLQNAENNSKKDHSIKPEIKSPKNGFNNNNSTNSKENLFPKNFSINRVSERRNTKIVSAGIQKMLNILGINEDYDNVLENNKPKHKQSVKMKRVEKNKIVEEDSEKSEDSEEIKKKKEKQKNKEKKEKKDKKEELPVIIHKKRGSAIFLTGKIFSQFQEKNNIEEKNNDEKKNNIQEKNNVEEKSNVQEKNKNDFSIVRENDLKINKVKRKSLKIEKNDFVLNEEKNKKNKPIFEIVHNENSFAISKIKNNIEENKCNDTNNTSGIKRNSSKGNWDIINICNEVFLSSKDIHMKNTRQSSINKTDNTCYICQQQDKYSNIELNTNIEESPSEKILNNETKNMQPQEETLMEISEIKINLSYSSFGNANNKQKNNKINNNINDNKEVKSNLIINENDFISNKLNNNSNKNNENTKFSKIKNIPRKQKFKQLKPKNKSHDKKINHLFDDGELSFGGSSIDLYRNNLSNNKNKYQNYLTKLNNDQKPKSKYGINGKLKKCSSCKTHNLKKLDFENSSIISDSKNDTNNNKMKNKRNELKNKLKNKLISINKGATGVYFYDGPIDLKFISLKNYEKSVRALEKSLERLEYKYSKIDFNCYKCMRGIKVIFIQIVKIKHNMFYYMITKEKKHLKFYNNFNDDEFINSLQMKENEKNNNNHSNDISNS